MAKSTGWERVSEEAKGIKMDPSLSFIIITTCQIWTIEPLFSWSVCKSANYFSRPSLLLEIISLSVGSNTCHDYKDSAIMKNLRIIFH